MGCVVAKLPGHLETPEGLLGVRYLYSPLTDDFVSLSDLDNDDIVPPSVLEGWERRLGIEIPKGARH